MLYTTSRRWCSSSSTSLLCPGAMKTPIEDAATRSHFSVLARWLQEWHATPSVVNATTHCATSANDHGPTALEWLQHQTSLPTTLIHKLFRQRVVRRYHQGKVRPPICYSTHDTQYAQVGPVTPNAVLPPGALLLIPTAVTKSHPAAPPISPAALQCYEMLMKHHVLYQDDSLLILNKPPGLAAQGGTNVQMSIDAALAAGAARHGLPPYRLVHRLDRDTSGAMAIARTKDTASFLAAMLDPSRGGPRGGVVKEYWAVVAPRDPAALKAKGSGMLRGMVAGRSDASGDTAEAAVSRWELAGMVGGAGQLGWLRLWPQTGRKHQLRVHCATLLDAPIVGDQKYGNPPNPLPPSIEFGSTTPLFLHSHGLRLPHPEVGMGIVDVQAPIPHYFQIVFDS